MRHAHLGSSYLHSPPLVCSLGWHAVVRSLYEHLEVCRFLINTKGLSWGILCTR
jgi:hypothetical protein